MGIVVKDMKDYFIDMVKEIFCCAVSNMLLYCDDAELVPSVFVAKTTEICVMAFL